MRIVIIDDHEVVREGLRAILSADPSIQVVGAAGTALAGLDEVRRHRPDVALVDLRLPDATGYQLCSQIAQTVPATAVLILSTYLNEETVRKSVEAGANGYVTKSAPLRELRRALQRVADGRTIPTGGAAAVVTRLHEAVTERVNAQLLTPRQEQILELCVAGLTYRQIAGRLFISEATVRWHIQSLKAKLGVHSKAELIATAIRSALIAPA